ncbi:MAG: hypothetical protein V3R60_00475 [Acidobacteriota bacterium]
MFTATASSIRQAKWGRWGSILLAAFLIAAVSCSPDSNSTDAAEDTEPAETQAHFQARMLARGASYGVTAISVNLESGRMVLAVNSHLMQSLGSDPERARRLASGFLDELLTFRESSEVAVEFQYQQEPILIARLEKGVVVVTQYEPPSGAEEAE